MTTYTGTPSDDSFTGTTDPDTVSIASISPLTTFSLDSNLQWAVSSTAGTDKLIAIEKVALLDGVVTFGPGGPQLANTTTFSVQQAPAVAVLANGERIVTWSSTGYTAKYGVYAQRFSANGEAIGSEFVVDAATAPVAHQPVITTLSGGGFVIAWTSSDTLSGVFAQRYDASGNPAGGQLIVHTTPQSPYGYGSQSTYREVSLAKAGDGGFAVSFLHQNNYSIDSGVLVARFDAAGTKLGTANSDLSNSNHSSSTHEHVIADLADGGHVIAHMRYTHSSYGDVQFSQAYIQRFDSKGAKVGGEIQIAPPANSSYYYQDTAFTGMDVTGLSGGGFVLAWSKSDGSMFTQRFDASGVSLGEPKLQFDGTPNRHTRTVEGIEDLSTGGYIVWWKTYDSQISGTAVQAQRFDATGAAVGNEITLATFQYAPTNGYEFEIASTTDGGFVVTWTGSDSEIHVAAYDALGLPVLNTLTGDANANTLTLTGTTPIRISGGAGDDVLTGGAGGDILDGGTGRDTLSGGAGDDHYIADTSDTILEAAGGGTDTVYISGSYTLDRNIEHGILLGTANANLVGNSANNRLTGNTGNNVLNGSTGADAMDGLAGDDTYIVDNIGDTIQEVAGNGTDTVVSTVSVTLSANVEHVRLSGAKAINATGNALDNRMTGNAAANVLDGGMGTDTLIGGAGNDTYVVDGADLIIEFEGAGIDTMQAGASATLGDHLENLTLTGTGHFSATGNELDNVITGNRGNNVLDGMGGADTMNGGGGNDILLVNDAGDVTLDDGGGTDTAKASVSHAIGEGIDNLILTGTLAINGTGNRLGNTITGNSAANILKGGGGSDTIYAGAGDDVLYSGDGITASTGLAYEVEHLYGGTGNDTYHVEADNSHIVELAGHGTDTVYASVTDGYTLAAQLEHLVLIGGDVTGAGNGLANSITGSAGANLLDGAAGADTMTGLGGDDTYLVDQAGDRVIEAADGGIDDVISAVSWTLGANVEELTLTGSLALAGTGNELNNRIAGNRGSNALSGGLGNDMLAGGDGNDTLDGGDGNDVLVAGTGDDTLLGGVGDDSLYAGGGTDVLDGGTGIDTAFYTTLAGGITIDLNLTGAQNSSGAGTQTLVDVENVSGSAVADDVLRGNAVANTLLGDGGADQLHGAGGNDILAGGDGDDRIDGGADHDMLTGGGGADLLDGGTGNDYLDGGSGDDTADYYLSSAAVTLDLNLQMAQNTTGSGLDTLLGIENLFGSKTGSDRLTGDDEDNILRGYGGNDTLAGGDGQNQLHGGDGNDVFLAHLGNDTIEGGHGVDLVDYSAATGAVSVMLSVSTRTNVAATAPATDYDREPTYIPGPTSIAGLAKGASTGSDLLFDIEHVKGTAFNDVIAGSAAANTLNGMGGADHMIGGDGSDTYYVDNAGDLVTETNGSRTTGGTDLVIASVSTTLRSNVEHLRLNSTANINGTGNSIDNTIYASSGVNVIDGLGGTDTLSYQDATAAAGTTTGVTLNLGLINSARQATATGISGKDLVKDVENLIGSRYNDVFTGTTGTNVLNGGAGNDTLRGGAGKDTFVFNTALSASTNVDRLSDFSVVDDTIQLDKAVFAKLVNTSALNSAHLRIGSAALDANDYLVYNSVTGALSYDADGSGSGAAVQFAWLPVGQSLTSADLFVI